MDLGKYILDGHKPVQCENVLDWATWIETSDRKVVKTKINNEVRVSTVFLGLDHNLGGKPMLFETMIFGGPLNEQMERYSTWEDAEAGHKRWVEKAKE